MSLLPPTLSSPAPAQTSSASSASSATPGRGDDASQGDAESFGDVLSRSLAASGEAAANPGGKPAVSVPAKRAADEKKSDAADAVNTAALLFIPLETRIAKAAGADARTAAAATATSATSGGAQASAPNATAATEQTADPAAALTTAAAANDASLATEAETQAAQALPASVLPATPAKDRALASAPDTPAPAGDELALTLPAGKVAGPANDSQAGQFSARDERPGDQAKDSAGKDIRVEQNPVAAKYSAMAANDAADKAADKAAAGAAQASAPAVAAHTAGAEAPAAGPSIAISAAAPPLHANAAPASPAAQAVPSQAALTPEVGSGEWGKALGQQMVHMGKAGEHVAELQLNPPGLGPLKVTLSLNDNQVQAMFVSAHSSVRAAVEAALPQLRSTLADSGINLGNTSVNSGSQQQQPAFAQNQGNQSGQRGQPGYLPADAAAPATALAPAPRRAASSGVDTYA